MVFTRLLPDMHHFNGRGGRVFPSNRDSEATAPNIAPGLLAFLERALTMGASPHTPTPILRLVPMTCADSGDG
jgi:hypothetical protein